MSRSTLHFNFDTFLELLQMHANRETPLSTLLRENCLTKNDEAIVLQHINTKEAMESVLLKQNNFLEKCAFICLRKIITKIPMKSKIIISHFTTDFCQGSRWSFPLLHITDGSKTRLFRRSSPRTSTFGKYQNS